MACRLEEIRKRNKACRNWIDFPNCDRKDSLIAEDSYDDMVFDIIDVLDNMNLKST